MIFSENRFPLFGIMLYRRGLAGEGSIAGSSVAGSAAAGLGPGSAAARARVASATVRFSAASGDMTASTSAIFRGFICMTTGTST